MNKPAAGWFQDPSDQPGQRYYDGQRWTSHFVPTPSPSAPAPPAVAVAVSSGEGPNALPTPPTPPPPPFGWYPPAPAPELPTLYLPNLIAAMIATVGVVIGSIGPWLTFLVFNRSNTDGDRAITLVLGIISAVALFVVFNLGRSRASGGDDTGRMKALGCLAVLAGSVCFVIGVIDAQEITSRKVDFFGTQIGPQISWGLWLTLIMSLVLVVTAGVVVRQVQKMNAGN